MEANYRGHGTRYLEECTFVGAKHVEAKGPVNTPLRMRSDCHLPKERWRVRLINESVFSDKAQHCKKDRSDASGSLALRTAIDT